MIHTLFQSPHSDERENENEWSAKENNEHNSHVRPNRKPEKFIFIRNNYELCCYALDLLLPSCRAYTQSTFKSYVANDCDCDDDDFDVDDDDVDGKRELVIAKAVGEVTTSEYAALARVTH